MSRQQKRAAKRQLNKKSKIINQFTAPQLAVIEEIVQQGTAERTEKRIEEIVAAIDRCISAYFFLRFDDMTCEEVRKEQEILSDLLDEDGEKLGLILKECGGNLEMAKKKMEKFEDDVRKVCEELLDKGIKNQGEAVKILQEKFPLSKSLLANAFKKCKEARKVEQEEDPEIVAAAEYIFGEDEKKPTVKVKEDKQKPQKQATEEKEEVPKVNTPVEDEKPVTEVITVEKPKLKVVSKTIVVEGQYGKYKLDDKGLEFADLKLKDTEELKEYETRIRAELESRITELEEVMAMA